MGRFGIRDGLGETCMIEAFRIYFLRNGFTVSCHLRTRIETSPGIALSYHNVKFTPIVLNSKQSLATSF